MLVNVPQPPMAMQFNLRPSRTCSAPLPKLAGVPRRRGKRLRRRRPLIADFGPYYATRHPMLSHAIPMLSLYHAIPMLPAIPISHSHAIPYPSYSSPLPAERCLTARDISSPSSTALSSAPLPSARSETPDSHRPPEMPALNGWLSTGRFNPQTSLPQTSLDSRPREGPVGATPQIF